MVGQPVHLKTIITNGTVNGVQPRWIYYQYHSYNIILCYYCSGHATVTGIGFFIGIQLLVGNKEIVAQSSSAYI